MVASNAVADLKAALNATVGPQHSLTISDAPAIYAHGPGCCQQPSSPTSFATGGLSPAAQTHTAAGAAPTAPTLAAATLATALAATTLAGAGKNDY